MSNTPTVSILDNGLHVISLRLPGRRSTALGIGLFNGVRHQDDSQDGFAHLLEHLLFSRAAADAHFAAMGGEVNAYTDRELTVLHGLVPGEASLDLLARFIDMLLHPGFDDNDLARETNVITQEREGLAWEDYLEETLLATALGHHPLSRPLLGTALPDQSRATPVPTARQLRHYLSEQLLGERLCVVAAGDVSHATLLGACRPLAALPRGARPWSPAPEFQSRRRSLSIQGNQTSLLWAMPAPAPAHPDYVAGLLANHLLGGGIGSRLHRRIREETGLAYHLRSRLDTYSDTGLWFIEAACAPAHAHVLSQQVHSTLQTLAQQGPTAAELDAARANLQARLLLEQDRPEAVLERLLREAFYLPAPLDETTYQTRLVQCTPARVQEVFAAALPRLACLCAAPAGQPTRQAMPLG